MPARTNASKTRTAQQKPQLSAVPSPSPSETPAAPVSSEPTPKPELTAVPTASETPKAKSKPEPKPVAAVDLGARQVTVWHPTATVTVDGKEQTLSCPHVRYSHESEAAAKRCIAQLVNQAGGRVG